MVPSRRLFAVGAKLMPHISPETEEDRVEKIRAARKLMGYKDKETVVVLPRSNLGPDGWGRTRDLAAATMGVSPTYVQWALCVQREDPELFEKIWKGQITVNAALRVLDGVTETESARRTRALRRELNVLFHDPDPRFLERLEQVVAEFRPA